MPVGHPIIRFASVESTNRTAAGLLAGSQVGHGAVIVAHEQTAGRGQRGNSWLSVPGDDLAMSAVLEPQHLRADAQSGLGKVVALAVADVVRGLVPGEVRIKWPNDVLVGRCKVAGILIENEVVGELVRSSIVGIGINANSSGFPAELAATSILLESGREVELHALLDRLCVALDARWNAFGSQDGTTDPGYAAQLWSRGRWCGILLDGRQHLARPMDVDAQGRLIVELEDGQVAAYGADRLRFAPR